jgi:hypothetical protein
MALLLLLLFMLHYVKTTNEPITVVVSKSLVHVGKRKTSPHRQKISIFSLSFFVLSLCQKQPPKRSCGVNGYLRKKQNSQEQQVYKGFNDSHGTLKHHHKNLAESDDATTTDSARDCARAKEERTQREREKNNMVGR